VTFSEIARERGIRSQRPTALEGIPEELRTLKYEAVLLDFDTVPQTRAILEFLRENPSNRSAVVFAVATGAAQKQEALDNGEFMFECPITAKDIRHAVRAAYGLMTRERRRYFRCAVELPISLKPRNGGPPLNCKTLNISSSGMAVSSSSSFRLGENVDILLTLETTDPVIPANGTIVWDDKHGKTGISFNCKDLAGQCQLDAWLDSQFVSQLEVSQRLVEENNVRGG
jgi:PilZ domain